MTKTLRRAAIVTAILMAPASVLLPGMASEAQAREIYGRIGFRPSHNVVVGFSFGDPFPYGHVHYSPVSCSYGSLYYYPAYDVYAHYIPRYRYGRYSRPFYHRDRYVIHTHSGYRGRDWGWDGHYRSGWRGYRYRDRDWDRDRYDRHRYYGKDRYRGDRRHWDRGDRRHRDRDWDRDRDRDRKRGNRGRGRGHDRHD